MELHEITNHVMISLRDEGYICDVIKDETTEEQSVFGVELPDGDEYFITIVRA